VSAPPAASRRRLAVIVNPVAGRGRSLETLRRARAELDRIGADYRVVESQGLEHARASAEAAVAAGETVVALGGDGLVGCLAKAVRGSAGALAIVPAGRGNDFARAIGVPRDPAAAARLAVEGRERLVDVGEVNDVPFLCIASVGLDSDVNRLASQGRRLGELAYFYAALRALAA
jgi:diacylglycerol kinase family enzyme